jgi:hypothetical protein
VIRAGKTAVGLMRSAWDEDNNFSKAGAAILLSDLTTDDLTHLAAVQTVWLLEQMEWIAKLELPDGETLCVEEQITSLGLEIARNEVGA